jgi:hypothetical protein
MRLGARFIAAIWWLSLVAWIAAIIAPAAAAMVAFPRLPELGAEIPATREFFAADPDGAGRFVAGYVTNPLFLAADRVRPVAALLMLAALMLTRGRPCGEGRLALAGVIAVGVAAIPLAVSLVFVASPLAASLEEWRAAVFAGDQAAAAIAKAVFDPLHVRASQLMRTELALVLLGVATCGAASYTPPRKPAS